MSISFHDLSIPEHLLALIDSDGFEAPTLIQEKAIPPALEGKDIVAGAKTGSGKTLIFALNIAAHYQTTDGVQALVLTPTRELAEQVTQHIQRYTQSTDASVVAVYGGVSIKPQIDKLKGADVVVATPGRLIDHLHRGTVDLSHVSTLVLDEADRMLDMGFIDDVETIIRACPRERQTLLFSATITEEVEKLARTYTQNHVTIAGESQVDPRQLHQVYYDVKEHQKLSLLVHLLEHEDQELVMVFCNTRKTVDFVTTNLQKHDINAQAIHGGFSQQQRDSAMETFHTGTVTVLVCTDVAARGLDIENVTHVYNYDIPDDGKQYVHRIGRTARAGAEGKAINLLAPNQHENFRRIIKTLQVKPKKVETPELKQLSVTKPPRHRKQS